MTEQEQYQAYRVASQAILDAKATIKILYKEAKNAGQKARSETQGTFQEKLTAVKNAVQPFHTKIAELESEITRLYEIADFNFDAYRGLVH
jgi:hypothetical protein